MADKSYEIEIKTTSDTTGVTELKEVLSETKTEAEEVSSSMDDLNSSMSDIDTSSVEEVNTAMQETSDATSEASDSTDQFGVAITSIDPSVIDQLKESMQEYNESAQEGSEATAGLVEGLASGGIATGLSSTFMGLANSAGSYNDSMLRMGLSLEGHAMTVDEVAQKYGASISKLSNETGRGAGSIRNHFANMGVAGVRNMDILEGSFQAVANGSFYSGESIESLSNKFQRISMTGMLSAKQLSSLGLTMEDLASVMGVSADEVSKKFKTLSVEQRASIMSQASASKYGTEVNGVFKQSWEGLWESLNKSKGGFERLVGELLLPYLIPAIETATWMLKGLTDMFKALPQPVKDVMGGVMLLMGSITVLGLGLNAVMRIGKLVISPFTSIAKLFGIDLDESVKKLATSLKTRLVSAFYSAKAKATEFAMSMKTNLVNAFNTVKLKIREVATALKSTLLNAFTTVKNFFTTQFIPALKNVATSLYTVGKNALISGYNALKSAGMWMIQKAQLIATHLWNGLVTISQWALNIAMSMNPIGLLIIAIVGLIAILGYLYFNNETVRNAIDGLGQTLMWLAQLIYTRVVTAFQNFVAGVQNAVNTFQNIINAIPQAIQSCLDWANNLILNHPIVKTAIWLGEQISSGFSAIGLGQHSPGKIYKAMKLELESTESLTDDYAGTLVSKYEKMGSGISDSFGNPSLDLISANLGNFSSGMNSSNSENNRNQTFNFYFEDVVVDNEDRMKKIVDYVRKELTWNNKTAGRTV